MRLNSPTMNGRPSKCSCRTSRANDRRVLNGIFWVLRSGSPWRDLPENFGLTPPATIVLFDGAGLACGTGL